jgi:signal transduction histidine kinase
MSDTQGTILVVDDHSDNLRTLSLILQAEGYKVRKAGSGAMALETVNSQLPDLILLDIRMPQMSGFEVCEVLKRSPSTCQVPVLFISASDEVDDKVKAFEIGGSDYITKPFRAQEVLARVRHQLIIQRQHQELAAVYQQVRHLNTHLEQQVQERTQALQQALDELQRLNQVKDDFLSTISHELRTPLANIHIVLQLLMAASRQGEDFFQKLSNADVAKTPGNKITQYLNILQEECDRELHLVQDLIDLQHLAADAQPLELTPVNLYDWIPYTVKNFETRTQKQQQTLVVKLAPGLPFVETDPTSLSRIMTELLNNACKFTPAGEVITVEVSAATQGRTALDEEIEQCVQNASPKIAICVSNTGIAIPLADLPRVFDKFYRIPSNDPWKHSGTGLGLALVKQLAEYLHASIEVASTNHLTCFTVKLPARLQPLST